MSDILICPRCQYVEDAAPDLQHCGVPMRKERADERRVRLAKERAVAKEADAIIAPPSRPRRQKRPPAAVQTQSEPARLPNLPEPPDWMK